MRAGAESKCWNPIDMTKPAKTVNEHWVEPDIRHLVTEDDTPVDNPFHERQQQLMSECIHTSFQPTKPFVCFTNVGLYPSPYVEALVPDMMLSLDVSLPEDIWEKGNRAYLVWRYGKPPDLVVEIVSNRKGGEDDKKLARYEAMRVPYYAIYEPKSKRSRKRPLRLFEMRGGQYVELLDPMQPLGQLGLKLILWEGIFRQIKGTYLRFTDLQDRLLLTAGEQLALELENVEQARATAEQAETKAEQAEAKAEQAEAKAEQASLEIERLKAKLRELGLEP